MKKYLAAAATIVLLYTLIAQSIGASASNAVNQAAHNRDAQIEAMTK